MESRSAGISFHQYELPGYPDSHACLRLAPDDDEWIYRWCASWKLSKDERTVPQEGTPVVVFGEYGWGKVKPWREADVMAEGAKVTTEELTETLQLLRDEVEPEISEEELQGAKQGREGTAKHRLLPIFAKVLIFLP